MATMLPPRYDESTSSAERRVFELLRSDPETHDWAVLHSLALSSKGPHPYGEIDFVVLVPDGGLVCLEVKGGRVSCRDGVWRTQDRFGRESELTRSPFQQVRQGMFKLRSAITASFQPPDILSEILIASAVVFPDVKAPPPTPEFDPAEYLDLVRLREPISRSVLRVIEHQRWRLGSAVQLRTSDLARLRAFLRPDFEVVVARSTIIARSEERLLRLTEDQFEVLDSLARNDRCLVEGAAGTGKTVLALEYGRRLGGSGRNVVIICFNRLLAQWLEEQAQTSNLGERLRAGSYHKLLRERIVSSSYSNEFLVRERQAEPGDLFTEIYPFFGELALLEGSDHPDVLIVDEAQDLAGEYPLSVLNAWVRGGLAGGGWALFGDFTRQSIYQCGRSDTAQGAAGNDQPTRHPSYATSSPDKAAPDIAGPETTSIDRFADTLRSYAPHFSTLILRKNCRNTKPVGEETALLAGFKALPYRLDDQDALPVDYRWWSDREDQIEKLRVLLASLNEDKVAPEDIMILSPSRFERSAAGQLREDPKTPVVPIEAMSRVPSGHRRSKTITFSTIQAFKGMESPVVVLCDIDRISGRDAESLLYIGMSRARSHLVVFLQNDLRSDLRIAVERRLKEGWTR